MTFDHDLSAWPDASDLCLACCAPGWVLGWLGAPKPMALEVWPQSCPTPMAPWAQWSQAVELALRQQLLSHTRLRVHWVDLPPTACPDWWPQHRGSLKALRAWAKKQGLLWGGGQPLAQCADLSQLWDLARRDATSSGAAPGSKPSNTRDTYKALTAALHRHPMALLAVSASVCLLVHLALHLGVHPWLQVRQEQEWARLEHAKQSEIQRLAHERELAHRAQESEHLKRWLQWQNQGMAPLHALSDLLRSSDATPNPQFWSGLRYADGAWTVQGVTGFESDLQGGLTAPLARGLPQILSSGQILWPPEPEWGWPAWRFEWRWNWPEEPRSKEPS